MDLHHQLIGRVLCVSLDPALFAMATKLASVVAIWNTADKAGTTSNSQISSAGVWVCAADYCSHTWLPYQHCVMDATPPEPS